MPRANTREKEAYRKLSIKASPPRPILRNAVVAFLVGGAICLVGQIVLGLISSTGIGRVQALSRTQTIMVFLGAFFTGLGLYDKLGGIAGMGAAIPITGFANSIVSPAMEFKREGFILGVSARMFQVAGPVIVYSFIASLLVSSAVLILTK